MPIGTGRPGAPRSILIACETVFTLGLEVGIMQWDLGAEGLALLAVMSLVFGVVAQVIFLGRKVWWVGLAGAVASFVIGLFISEVWFGWATEAELQPNIGGLSFDEVLIGFLLMGVVVLMARYLTRDRAREATAS